MKKITLIVLNIIFILVSIGIIGTSLTVTIEHFQKSSMDGNKQDIVSLAPFIHCNNNISSNNKTNNSHNGKNYDPVSHIDKKTIEEARKLSEHFDWPCDIFRLLIIFVFGILLYQSSRKLTKIITTWDN